MSRNELNASQLAELAALDAILARDPVGEEHLELAALVDSVRAGAPHMERDFAARLDAQVAQRRHRRRRVGRPSRRRLAFARPTAHRLALAGGGLVAAAVTLTIVISAGLLDGRSAGSSPAAPGALRALGHGGAATSTLAPPSTGAGAAANRGAASRPTVGTSSSGAPAFSSSPATPSGSARLVQRGSTLTLASPPAAMQGIANQIVAATEQQGGVVQSSDVNISGPSSYSSFSLQVPGGRLGSLIATLSALASVRTLTQSTHDITDGYNQETARLADSVAERSALLKKLAIAATAADAASFQQQLDALARRIAAEHRAVDALLRQGHTASLQVNVLAGPPTAKHSIAAGPLSEAFRTARHALEEILAIALIAFAIVLPFALSALALWWAAAGLRQRARERAMRTA